MQMIFKNKWDELFIDLDNFPIIKTTIDWRVLCPICNTRVCCSVKACKCWYEKKTLNDAYVAQKQKINWEVRTKLLEVRKENGEWVDAEWKIIIHQSQQCPNPNCKNFAYYCRNWCQTDKSFDMSIYNIVNKMF